MTPGEAGFTALRVVSCGSSRLLSGLWFLEGGLGGSVSFGRAAHPISLGIRRAKSGVPRSGRCSGGGRVSDLLIPGFVRAVFPVRILPFAVQWETLIMRSAPNSEAIRASGALKRPRRNPGGTTLRPHPTLQRSRRIHPQVDLSRFECQSGPPTMPPCGYPG